MDRLAVLKPDEWEPREMHAIAMLDFEPHELTLLTGWHWTDWEVDGLGRMANVLLAWNGTPRFWLQASRSYPADGISVEVPRDETDLARARADFIACSGLDVDAFLAIREGDDQWFARWDGPHEAGVRPASATGSPRQLRRGGGADPR